MNPRYGCSGQDYIYSSEEDKAKQDELKKEEWLKEYRKKYGCGIFYTDIDDYFYYINKLKEQKDKDAWRKNKIKTRNGITTTKM